MSRLQAALEKRAPEVLSGLNRGASATQIARLKRALGKLPLPASFFAFYRWHDGSDEDTRWLDGLFMLDGKGVASVKAMMDGILDEGHYAQYEPDEYWSKGWVAFADDGSGHGALVIDTVGSFGGTPGQVMWAAAKELDRVVVAPSFDAWLEHVTQIYEDGAVEDGLFDPDARRPKSCKGYPKAFSPREVATSSATGDLREPTRDRWPKSVPVTATWLVQPGDAKSKHFVIASSGKGLATYSGDDPAALKETVKTIAKAKRDAEHDKLLRAKLKAGFTVLGGPRKPKRGDVLVAMQTNSQALTALAGDGRTLIFATVGRDAKGASLFAADAFTGRRKLLHEVPAGRHQTFVHMVDVDADDRPIWQIGGKTQRFDPATGAMADVAVFREEAPFNAHCSHAQLNADGTRLFAFHEKGVRVIEGGEVIFEAAVPKSGTRGNCYGAISPSGRRVALLYDDFEHGGVSDVDVFEVDGGERLAGVPTSIRQGWALSAIGFSPDDALLLVSDHRAIEVVDIAGGAPALTLPDMSHWAFAPNGKLAVFGRRGVALELRRFPSRRGVATFGEGAPWAQPHAEIHDVARLRFSRDGRLLLHATKGGTTYLWKV